METIETTINTGKYSFQITDNTLSTREQIYCRKVIISGKHSRYVNVSISYSQNSPLSASISHILYDEECSFDTPIDRDEGSITILKTLFQYIHTQLPTITEVKFEDNSNIEFVDENEIPLYYFSIAFNGETWYEKHFNARQKDKIKHDKYKAKINELLYSTQLKNNTSFIQFLQIAKPPIEIIDELEKYYIASNTFGLFFQSIPKQHRCRLVGSWIEQFMKFILKDVFYNENWIIHFPIEMSGGNNKIRNKNNKTRKYYCPKGIITNNFQSKNICVTPQDI
jgi:hypothetical protein